MTDDNAARVLVVDDEPSVLETVMAILRRSGYQVVGVADAEVALTHLRTEDFDAMLTDLRLESASGLSLIAELNRVAPDTPAIVLTGYASLESAIDALREGVYDYLIKPCAVEELKATVGRAVERRRLGVQLRQRLHDLDESNAKLAGFNAELSMRVDEATAELQRRLAELDETKRRLEEIQAEREAMVSLIAHELGQPLTVIRSFSQWLNRPNLPPDRQAQAVKGIVDGTRRLERLINDLRDYSLLAAGRFRIDPAPCDLVEILQEQVNLVQVTTQLHTFSLDVEFAAFPYHGDRDRLAQVISNILGNAVKYSEGGRVQVILRGGPSEIYLSVVDQGPGIPVEYREAIFEPYRRVTNEQGQSVSAKGTGLGLFIARGVIEAHGGKIWVEGQTGATFVIALPRAVPVSSSGVPAGDLAGN